MQGFQGYRVDIRNNTVGFSCQTVEGSGFGTPTHMPPEQFTNAASCDERSDIYSFGIVLYQMATGGNLPFLHNLPRDNSNDEHIQFWHEMHRLHSLSPVPRINSPFFPIIQRCLEKEPKKRYQSFTELRLELEPLLKKLTGEVIKIPEKKELESWEWSNKGVSLSRLGRHQEAIACYDMAIEIDPEYVEAWHNKGSAWGKLGRYQEAITCFDKALEIDPEYVEAWHNKGSALGELGKHQEAITCFDKALEIDPEYVEAWHNKGSALGELGRHQDEIACYDKAIEMDPRCARIWYNKGVVLAKLGKHQEAIACFDRTIEVDPRHANAWFGKGVVLGEFGRYQDAIDCYDRALEIDPRNADVWLIKGSALAELGRHQEAIEVFENFVKFAPPHDADQVIRVKAFIQELKTTGKGTT
ncbi:MAG: tetratricopeptide repeat protein [Candidatus Omnitrophica bacterium]|nr:tetratricopeptide repeat protein [Candidatus Omnitrophota bacterium]